VILEATVMTALATGALGSAHCAAMCGPLAAAGCGGETGLSARKTAGYFLGRAAAYTTMGAVLGHIGRHALCILPMGALEGIAIFMVAAAAAYRGISLLRRKAPGDRLIALGTAPKKRATRPWISLVGELLPRRGLGLGLATGVMPCGLLLPAWALAAGTASAAAGAAVMAAFSLATMPGLLVPIVGRGVLERALARVPVQAYGVAWCALSVWVAVRPWLVASGKCH
jgi:uncharacterized protein